MEEKSRECLFQAHKDESKPSMISGVAEGNQTREGKGYVWSEGLGLVNANARTSCLP